MQKQIAVTEPEKLETAIAFDYPIKAIMLSNITSNHRQETSLQEGDLVYLYGDINYTGTLVHPVERTYPPKWTVELDRGGYEAVNIQHLSLITSHALEPNPEITFSDAPESSLDQLQREIIALKRENARLQQENELIKKDLDLAKQVIRRAKDISPIMRINLKRVLRLAHQACMDVQRTVRGWILKMGNKARRFRRLADIWDLLSQDDFLLSEIFPEDQLIAIDLILPPRRRKRPTPAEKKTFPLMRPEDVIRNRSMLLFRSG